MYYAKNYLLQERLQFTAAHIDMNVAIFTGRVSFLSFFQPREKNKVESIVGCLNKTRKYSLGHVDKLLSADAYNSGDDVLTQVMEAIFLL